MVAASYGRSGFMLARYNQKQGLFKRCTFRRMETPTLFQHNDFPCKQLKVDYPFVGSRGFFFFFNLLTSTSFKGQKESIQNFEN